MTEMQKAKILKMRNRGATYAEIAEATNISKGTIKSYISRIGVPAIEELTEKNKCKYCGGELEDVFGRNKIFCSEKCKAAWWSRNRIKKSPKKKYTLHCECCGNTFEASGRRTQKYCSHDCYINARFGGVKCG